jgi:hypothetical protein
MEKREVIGVGQFGNPRRGLVPDVVAGPFPPSAAQLRETVMGLVRAGLQHRPLAQVEHLDIGRLAAMRGHELGDERVLAVLDGRRAPGELGHRRLGDAGHLEAELVGVPPAPTVPAPPEPLGQEVRQDALVQLGEHHHRLEQPPAIQRPPRPIRHGSGTIGDHHMIVELRVTGMRVPMGERGGHHAVDVLLDHAVGARPGVEHLTLGVGQHHVDGRWILEAAGSDLLGDRSPLLPTREHPHWTEPTTAQFTRVRRHFSEPKENPVWAGTGQR